jgi:hypothetical protein
VRARLDRREGTQRVVGDDVLASEACLELGLGREILGLDQIGQRLVDQHDHRVVAEVALVVGGRLVAGRRLADERVRPRRRLQAERQHPAADREREHDPDRQHGPACRGPGKALKPIRYGHRIRLVVAGRRQRRSPYAARPALVHRQRALGLA